MIESVSQDIDLCEKIEKTRVAIDTMREVEIDEKECEIADPVKVLPQYAFAQYKQMESGNIFNDFDKLTDRQKLAKTESFQEEQKEIMDEARCERDIRNLVRFVHTTVDGEILNDTDARGLNKKPTLTDPELFKQFENALVISMKAYREKKGGVDPETYKERLLQAFEKIVPDKKYLEKDPLLADLLASWVTGDSSALWAAAQERMLQWTDRPGKLKDPSQVNNDAENHRPGMTTGLDWWSEYKPYVVNWETDQVVELRTSLADILSTKDGILARYFSKETHTQDTPLNLYAQIDATTPQLKEIRKEMGDEASEAQVKIEYQKCLWVWMMKQIGEAKDVVGFGHGFGANAKVARPAMHALLDSPDNRKRIGLSVSTKGAEKTTVPFSECGRMDRAAWQITTTLDALGIAGCKNVVWLGHSMGGQEAIWLPIFAKKNWNLKTIALTPVVSAEKDFLLLLNSPLGQIVDKMARLPAPFRANVLKLGEQIWIPQAILGYFINFKELPADAFENNLSQTSHAVDIHSVEFATEYITYVAEGLRQLTGQVMSDEIMQMIFRLYGNMIEGVVIGTKDKVLHPEMMYDILVYNYFNKKKLKDVEAPHYVFLVPEGMKAVGEVTNTAMKSLSN